MWQLTVERRPRSGKPPPPNTLQQYNCDMPGDQSTHNSEQSDSEQIQHAGPRSPSLWLVPKPLEGKEGGGEGTREKGGGGGESAAPSSQNLRRRPLVENRIPIAPSGEKRYSCLKALRSNCLASPLCETLCQLALCEARCHLEDVIRVNLYKNT